MTDQVQVQTREKQFVLGALIVASLPLFYLLYDLLNYRNDMSPWLAMRLVGVKLELAQQKLYIDFWDWTQPIVFEAMKGPMALRAWLEGVGVYWPPDLFAELVIWFLVFLSVILSGLIALQALQKINQAGDMELRRQLLEVSMALLFSIGLSSLIMRFDLGDLPHILVLALAPWTLMRWLAYREIRFRPWLAMSTGALAGVAACFDLPFVLVFLAIELGLALEKGTARPLVDMQWLGFALAFAVYVLRLLQLDEPSYTYFWKWTMPLKMLNYQVFDNVLFAPESSPDRRDILYGLAAAVGLAFLLAKKNTFFLPMLTTMLCGLVMYIIEKQGFSRDLSLAVFGATVCFSLTLLIVARSFINRLFPEREVRLIGPYKYPTLVLASAIVTVVVGCSLNWDRDRMHTYVADHARGGYSDLLTVFYDNQVWKNPVMVIADYPSAAYPNLLSLGAQTTGYMLWARPLRLLDWVKHHEVLTQTQKDFYAYICRKVAADLRSGRAKLIVMETMEGSLLVKSGLATFLDQNYKKGEECRYYSYNRQPREFVGYWYFDQFLRKP